MDSLVPNINRQSIPGFVLFSNSAKVYGAIDGPFNFGLPRFFDI